MNFKAITFGLLTLSFLANSMDGTDSYKYSANKAHPFGQYNPSAPSEIKQFTPLIGQANCQSQSRIDQNTWADSVDMLWTFRYILNGTAVQDETLKSDGTHSGSIRQFNTNTQQWHVHYYTSLTMPDELPAWKGGLEGDDLVFWKAQKAPNGVDGFYRLTFFEINDSGYQWIGEWVDQSKTVVYPTWKIKCTKV